MECKSCGALLRENNCKCEYCGCEYNQKNIIKKNNYSATSNSFGFDTSTLYNCCSSTSDYSYLVDNFASATSSFITNYKQKKEKVKIFQELDGGCILLFLYTFLF